MKTLAIAAFSAAALALAGCGHKTADTADTSTNVVAPDAGNQVAAATPTAGQTFANAAATSDAFEIATSKLALTASTSPAIKKYAQKMIDAHTDSTAKLMAAAAAAAPAIMPDPTLTSDQQAKVDALKAMTGKAFDQAYVADQTEGHQKTLDTLRAYAGTGDVPQLKTFATTTGPVVAAHLNMAKALKA